MRIQVEFDGVIQELRTDETPAVTINIDQTPTATIKI